jgi:hypothetical protein
MGLHRSGRMDTLNHLLDWRLKAGSNPSLAQTGDLHQRSGADRGRL